MIGRRRFWDAVAVEPAGAGFGVTLDGRPLRTPAQAALELPTRALAEAVAAEWRAVEADVRPEGMFYTRAANAAIDRVAPAPGPVADAIAAYGASDLVCYRAGGPPALVRRQAEGWDPLLDWSATALGAPLTTIEGLMPRDQSPESLAALREAVAAEDAFGLTALHELVVLSGSLLIGLAVARGRLAPEAAWNLACIDEAWQAEQWGRDEEAEAAAARRRADFLRAAAMCEMLADLAGPAPSA